MHPDRREQLVSHILDVCNNGVGMEGLNSRQSKDLRFYLNYILDSTAVQDEACAHQGQ